MSGLCGWSGDLVAPEAAAAALDAMAAKLTLRGCGAAQDAAQALRAPAAGLAVTGAARTCGLAGAETIWAAWEGRPRWSDAQLGAIAAEAGHARALIEAYRRHGTGFLARLEGPFACAVLDLAEGRALLAIDRAAVRPLFYSHDPAGGLVFASTAESLKAHPAAAVSLDPASLYNFLVFDYPPGPRTIYREIAKLLPGGYVAFDRHKGLETGFYWSVPYAEADARPEAELRGELMAVLRGGFGRAVAGERLSDLGAFLSGGLDSSTVTGLLSEAGGGPARSFTIGFTDEDFDETRYARATARHFATDHREYFLEHKDIYDLVEPIAAAYDEPFVNTSVFGVYHCAKLAREAGVTVMLAGDGGDELFGGNTRYAKEGLYELYRKLPEALRRGLIEPVALGLPGAEQVALLRKARNYVSRARIPLPDRWFLSERHRQAPLAEALSPEAAAGVDPLGPLEVMRAAFERPCAASGVKRMMHYDLQLAIADNDLRKVNRACELAGVEVIYPLLDEAVIAFSAALPSRLLVRGARLRYFYKRALAHYLPPEVIDKQKHGFGVPFVDAITGYAPLRDLAYDCAAASKARGLLNPAFVERILVAHRAGGDAQAADLLWSVMMLELWLSSHLD